jgi:hypothetical protein
MRGSDWLSIPRLLERQVTRNPDALAILAPGRHDVNLKTAKALGLTIPPSVLARADEIIQ